MEKNPENDFYQMPVQPVFTESGEHLSIEVPYVDGSVHTRIWQAQVGRVRLYLLDTNLDENSPADRDFTARLYGGDEPMRIRQEILLGIGGLRALQAVGVEPTICHMNEGHSAFFGPRAYLPTNGRAGLFLRHRPRSQRHRQCLYHPHTRRRRQ